MKEYSWESVDTGDINLGSQIQKFKCLSTDFIAYYITNKNTIVNTPEYRLKGEYEQLKNNYGIYFLLGDKGVHGELPTIYIGQASAREKSSGMDRLKEHVNTKTESYKDKWEHALFVTHKDNKWSTAVLDTLEKLFIAHFKPDENYECLNGKLGQDGNTPYKEYGLAYKSIVELLAYRVKYPIKDYENFETAKTENAVLEKIADTLVESAEYVKNSVKDEIIQERLKQCAAEDRSKMLWIIKTETYEDVKKSIAFAANLIFNNRIVGGTKGEVITKKETARDMVYEIPADQFHSKATFIDIACKTGIYLECLIDRLMSDEFDLPINHEPEFENKLVRLNHIINNMLYGVCISENGRRMSTYNIIKVVEQYQHNLRQKDFSLSVFDNINILPNIIYINGYDEKYASKIAYQDFIYALKHKFNKEEASNLKFDVVIGNPPYNNDIYLDFVALGHMLSSKYTCMITPAKWQAKTDGKPKGSKTFDKNEQFRKQIVPYMSKIIFYKDTHDVFDIDDNAGMCYYIIDKNKHNIKEVKTICTKNSTIESDFEKHDESKLTLFNHKILSVIGKVGTLGEGFKQSLYVKNTDHGEISIDGTLGFKRCTFVGEQERGEQLRAEGYAEIMQGNKVCGYKRIDQLYTSNGLDKYKVICSIMIGGAIMFGNDTKVIGSPKFHCIGPYQVPKGSFPVVRYFEHREQGNSFISYFETKLVSFLFYFGVCGATITKEFFRFIPDPTDWSVIYEDKALPGYEPDKSGVYIDKDGKKHCSLYVKYGLTEEEISIIESVIKERK